MEPYSEVWAVSATWVLFAYAQMPMGPTSGFTNRSPGHQKWGNRIFMVSASDRSRSKTN